MWVIFFICSSNKCDSSRYYFEHDVINCLHNVQILLNSLFLNFMDATFKVLREFKNGLHTKYYGWNISKGYGLGKQNKKVQNTILKS